MGQTTKVERPYHNNKQGPLESGTLNTLTHYPACQAERLCVTGIDNNILEGQQKGGKRIFESMCACKATNKGRHGICLNSEQPWLA